MVSGKCSDLCVSIYKYLEMDGYAPRGLGIGGGDYIEFGFCADCGTIQGFVPLSDAEITAALTDE
jgi:hypothetical protein